MSNVKNKPPITKFREQGLTVSVLEREIDNGTVYDVSFERSYKDKDGKWQNTSSVPANQIQTLRKLLDMAHTFILEADAR